MTKRKLTFEQVEEMRERHMHGEKQTALAAEYGLKCIYHIIKGNTYKPENFRLNQQIREKMAPGKSLRQVARELDLPFTTVHRRARGESYSQ